MSIYRAQGFKTDALEVLDSANLGIASPTAKGEWDFVRTKLELLEEQADWKCVWTVCKDLLNQKRTSSDQGQSQGSTAHAQGDGDWRVWSALVRADSELHSTKSVTEFPCEAQRSSVDVTHSFRFTEATRTLIDSYLSCPRPGRNSLLANILHLKNQSTRGRISGDSTELLSAFQRYLEVFGAKDCCYNDLCEHFEETSSDTQALLLAGLESPGPFSGTEVDEDVKVWPAE